MSDDGGRAVAIGLSGANVRMLADALAASGYALAGQAPDGESGLALVQRVLPDLAAVSAVMPGMDGARFVRRVRELRLLVQPSMLLFRHPGLRLPGEETLSGWCTATAGLPPDARGVRDALDRLARQPRTLPPEKAARLEALLDALGVPRHPGRGCLAHAVTLAWHDGRCLYGLREKLYPRLARQSGLTPAQVERAIRHVIEVAWQSGEIEQQHRIFGDTIDARRGKPTCGEMIAQLAEELRWEA